MKKLLHLLIVMLAITSQTYGQTKTVTGTVTGSDDKLPLAGVSILIKGTSVGTQTGSNGQFSIKVPSGQSVLVFTFIGYNRKEVNVGPSTTLRVSIDPNSSELSEIVVTGYGTQRRKDVIGSIAKVKGEEIENKPIQSFDQALAGRAAGVQITSPNGVLNNPPVFRIRGTNSISLSSYPLIVIDGIATFTDNQSGPNITSGGTNPLASINPNDIESIDILKDASASAIYGSRAANGVVIITTKRGKTGKAAVTYDAWTGWTKPQNLPSILNAFEYTTIKNEGLVNAGTFNATTNYFALTNGADGQPINTNWYDYIYRTGFSQSHSISIAGGSESTKYYLSTNYTAQEGIVRRNDFNRKLVLFNIDHTANKFITVGAKLSYSNEENLAAVSSGSLNGQAFGTAGLGRLATLLSPNVSPYNIDGTYNINTSTNQIGTMNNRVASVGFTNPQVALDLDRSNNENNHIQSSVYLTATPLKWLSLKTIYGIDYLYSDNETFGNAVHGDSQPSGGTASSFLYRNKRYVWTNTLNANHTFGKHSLSFLAGNEQQRSTYNGYGLSRATLSDAAFDVIQAGFATNGTAGLGIGENYLVSFFSNLNYDYGKKYYLQGSIRKDSYSGFGPDKKDGIFYGFGVGWEVANEKFWTEIGADKIFSSLRFKGSYGKVGNSNGLNDYAPLSFYGNGLYGGAATLVPTQSGNNLIGWETSKKLDVGVNFGILQNKITGEINYYNNNLDGLIYSVPQAPSAGLPSNPQVNVASMYNKGYEFTINVDAFRGKKFSWTPSFNISYNENKINSLATGITQFTTATSGLETASISRVGYPLGMIYVVRTAGVDPNTGRRIFLDASGRKVFYQTIAPAGQFNWSYEDGTRANTITQAADGVVYKNTQPKFYGGFDNTFRFKNFDLNLTLTYQLGFSIYYGSNAGLRDQRFWNNSTDVLRRWTAPGQNTDIPKIVNGDNVSNGSSIPLDVNVFKGDFLKVRNLAFGYTLPQKWLQKTKAISNARLYVSGQNLFIFTAYPGPDPEISSNGQSTSAQGIDRNQVVSGRVITAGVSVKF